MPGRLAAVVLRGGGDALAVGERFPPLVAAGDRVGSRRFAGWTVVPGGQANQARGNNQGNEPIGSGHDHISLARARVYNLLAISAGDRDLPAGERQTWNSMPLMVQVVVEVPSLDWPSRVARTVPYCRCRRFSSIELTCKATSAAARESGAARVSGGTCCASERTAAR